MENRFTLSNGEEIVLPPHDEFYAQLVARNRGLISAVEQERLRRATILIAGCGSIGGAVIEPLVRMGAEHLVLAEPDGYDLHNMNRQSVRLQDLGRNKAEVFQERLRDVNPYASIRVDPRGICDENVEALVREATLIIDGVDVTTKAPLRLKFALHQWAKQLGVPVVSGYDIADLQLVPIYDYRRPATAGLHGRVRAQEIEDLEPFDFLRRVVPNAAIPYEMIAELQRQLRGEREGFPQLISTANLFSALPLRAVLDLLAGRPVRRQVIVDVPTLLRPVPTRLRVAFARLYGLAQVLSLYRAQRRGAERVRREA
jgi:molybdopterin/thiamine biosynthesis adenylyltransferase